MNITTRAREPILESLRFGSSPNLVSIPERDRVVAVRTRQYHHRIRAVIERKPANIRVRFRHAGLFVQAAPPQQSAVGVHAHNRRFEVGVATWQHTLGAVPEVHTVGAAVEHHTAQTLRRLV